MNFDSFQEFIKSFSKIEPLSNYQIIEKCKELQIKTFKGVYMRDELRGKSTRNECLILNHDIGKNNGTHWTALFIRNGASFYFDSFGFDPPLEIKSYCSESERYCSTTKIQDLDEVICGHYCIFMLYKLSNDYKFFDVLNELYNINH